MIILNYNFNNINPKIKKELCIANKSEFYIILLILSQLISLRNVHYEKERILSSAFFKENLKNISDTFCSKILSNSISIMAALFYFCVAKDDYYNNDDPSDCSPLYSLTTETLLVVAAFISLYNNIYEKQRYYSNGEFIQDNTIEQEEDDLLSNIPII